MRTATFVLVALLATAGSAAAEEPAPKLHMGVQAGIVLPQVASELTTALGVSVESGYRVWRNLSPFVAVGYSQPPVDHTATDARITADEYSTSTTQRELTVTAGAMWHLFPAEAPLNAFGSLGVRCYYLQTLTNGTAGEASFLENRERSLRVGGVAALGGEYRLGPGAAMIAAEIGGSDLPHLVTGEVWTTAAALSLGYRLFF